MYRRPPSFWRLLLESFEVIGKGLGVLIAIALSFVLWIWNPEQSVSLALAIIFLIAVLLLGIPLFRAAYVAHDHWVNRIPRVLMPIEPPGIYSGIDAALLLEPSDLFSQDSLVSVYHRDDDGVERLLGLGRVLIVQENLNIQVGVDFVEPGAIETFESLKRNPQRLKRQLLVKPTIPQVYIDYLAIEVTEDE